MGTSGRSDRGFVVGPDLFELEFVSHFFRQLFFQAAFTQAIGPAGGGFVVHIVGVHRAGGDVEL